MLKPYHAICSDCGAVTSRKYANAHQGQCKLCAEGAAPRLRAGKGRPYYPDRNAMLINCGPLAVAAEEGHFNYGDF